MLKKFPDLEAKEEREVLGDMEVKEAGMEATRKIFAQQIFPAQKEGKEEEEGWNGKNGENGEEGSVCLENLKSQNHQAQNIKTKEEFLETNQLKFWITKTKERMSYAIKILFKNLCLSFSIYFLLNA